MQHIVFDVIFYKTDSESEKFINFLLTKKKNSLSEYSNLTLRLPESSVSFKKGLRNMEHLHLWEIPRHRCCSPFANTEQERCVGEM